MEDGCRIELRRWGDPGRARALALALHGFNDYANAFAELADYLAENRILTYAYDQRGFGTSPTRGLWAGDARLVADLKTLVRRLRRRHPDLPIYLIGESMGAAVIMAAAPGLTEIAGLVLIAPAVWDRASMPALQRWLLDAAAGVLPGARLTGSGLNIRPSDNIQMLRAYSADPLVIKATRIDALQGITNLMDRAAAAAPLLPAPALILYGEHDEIIPPGAYCALLDDLPAPPRSPRLVLYPSGWHMLTRDLQGAWVLADIAAWIRDPAARLPSAQSIGRDDPRLRALCPSPSPDERPRRDRTPTFPAKS